MSKFYTIGMAHQDDLEESEIPLEIPAIFDNLLNWDYAFDKPEPYEGDVDRMSWFYRHTITHKSRSYRLFMDHGGTWHLFLKR